MPQNTPSGRSEHLTDKIPQLSANDIEVKAEQVIKYFDLNLLSTPQAVPIREFASQTKHKFAIDYRTDIDLGTGPGGKKCLGQFRTTPRGIFIDQSLEGSDRFPFVLAHEYGHFVLHRKIDPVKCGYTTSSLDDAEVDFVTHKKVLTTPRDWIEWQANRFASAILMPRATFSDALIDFHKQQGWNRQIGVVIVNATQQSRRDFNHTLGALSLVYSVNRTNIECRLRDLQLLQDHRNPETRHISQLFKED